MNMQEEQSPCLKEDFKVIVAIKTYRFAFKY